MTTQNDPNANDTLVYFGTNHPLNPANLLHHAITQRRLDPQLDNANQQRNTTSLIGRILAKERTPTGLNLVVQSEHPNDKTLRDPVIYKINTPAMTNTEFDWSEAKAKKVLSEREFDNTFKEQYRQTALPLVQNQLSRHYLDAFISDFVKHDRQYPNKTPMTDIFEFIKTEQADPSLKNKIREKIQNYDRLQNHYDRYKKQLQQLPSQLDIIINKGITPTQNQLNTLYTTQIGDLCCLEPPKNSTAHPHSTLNNNKMAQTAHVFTGTYAGMRNLANHNTAKTGVFLPIVNILPNNNPSTNPKDPPQTHRLTAYTINGVVTDIAKPNTTQLKQGTDNAPATAFLWSLADITNRKTSLDNTSGHNHNRLSDTIILNLVDGKGDTAINVAVPNLVFDFSNPNHTVGQTLRQLANPLTNPHYLSLLIHRSTLETQLIDSLTPLYENKDNAIYIYSQLVKGDKDKNINSLSHEQISDKFPEFIKTFKSQLDEVSPNLYPILHNNPKSHHDPLNLMPQDTKIRYLLSLEQMAYQKKPQDPKVKDLNGFSAYYNIALASKDILQYEMTAEFLRQSVQTHSKEFEQIGLTKQDTLPYAGLADFTKSIRANSKNPSQKHPFTLALYDYHTKLGLSVKDDPNLQPIYQLLKHQEPLLSQIRTGIGGAKSPYHSLKADKPLSAYKQTGRNQMMTDGQETLRSLVGLDHKGVHITYTLARASRSNITHDHDNKPIASDITPPDTLLALQATNPHFVYNHTKIQADGISYKTQISFDSDNIQYSNPHLGLQKLLQSTLSATGSLARLGTLGLDPQGNVTGVYDDRAIGIVSYLKNLYKLKNYNTTENIAKITPQDFNYHGKVDNYNLNIQPLLDTHNLYSDFAKNDDILKRGTQPITNQDFLNPFDKSNPHQKADRHLQDERNLNQVRTSNNPKSGLWLGQAKMPSDLSFVLADKANTSPPLVQNKQQRASLYTARYNAIQDDKQWRASNRGKSLPQVNTHDTPNKPKPPLDFTATPTVSGQPAMIAISDHNPPTININEQQGLSEVTFSPPIATDVVQANLTQGDIKKAIEYLRQQQQSQETDINRQNKTDFAL